MSLLNYLRKSKAAATPAKMTPATAEKSASSSAAGPQPLRLWKVLLVTVLTSSLGGGAVYGLMKYRQQIAWEKANCINPMDLRLTQSTPWMTPEIAAEVQSSLKQLPSRLSVMDPESARKVGQCLEANPWVSKVYYVRLDKPRSGKSNGIEISMAFRRPVAFVEVGQGAAARYFMVDRDGVRLGSHGYTEPQLGDRVLLTITGTTSHAPEPGDTWNDPAVLAGADVAGLFRDYVVKFNLARVDVANLGSQRTEREAEIVLYTKQGRTRIDWGGPPRDHHTETLEGWTADDKVQCLDKLYQKYGGIDGRMTEIDLIERQVRGLAQPATPPPAAAPRAVRS